MTKKRQPAGPRRAPDGTWFFVVSLPKDRHQARRRGFRTRREAQEEFDKLRTSKVAPSKQTTADYLTAWLAGRHDLRPGTAKRYAILIRRHVTPAVGHHAVQKLVPSDLNGLYAGMLTATPPLKLRTVRFVHSVIRKALADGVRSGELAANIADRATPPSSKAAKAPATAHWSQHQLRDFLALSAGHEHAVLFRVAATTGLRRGELGALQWNRDVDLDTGKLTVREGLAKIDGRWMAREPKTERGRRTIGIDATTVAALRKHRQSLLERRLAIGVGWHDHDLVFPDVTGGPADTTCGPPASPGR